MVERQDWEEKYKRARADYVNLERRVRKQQEDLVKYTNEVLLKKLLPILDDLEKAVASGKDEGLNLLLKNFGEVLKLEGVEEISVEAGDKFDPKIMEGVITESIKDAEGTEAKVTEVLRKGYKIREKVLRPAEVKVRGSDAKNNRN